MLAPPIGGLWANNARARFLDRAGGKRYTVTRSARTPTNCTSLRRHLNKAAGLGNQWQTNIGNCNQQNRGADNRRL